METQEIDERLLGLISHPIQLGLINLSQISHILAFGNNIINMVESEFALQGHVGLEFRDLRR